MEIVQTRGEVSDERYSGWIISAKDKNPKNIGKYVFRDQNDKERMMVVGEKALPENWREQPGIVRVLKKGLTEKKPLLWFKELADKVKNIDFLTKWTEPKKVTEESADYNWTQRRFMDQKIPRSPVEIAEANKVNKPINRVADQLGPKIALTGEVK